MKVIVIATDKGYDHSDATHCNDDNNNNNKNNSIYLYSALQSIHPTAHFFSKD